MVKFEVTYKCKESGLVYVDDVIAKSEYDAMKQVENEGHRVITVVRVFR